MKKNKTIGVNPLTEYLSASKEKPVAKKAKQVVEEEQLQSLKQRVTIHVSVDLIDRVKNAVYWEPGLTLAGFAQDAFEKALEKLEKRNGEPYPMRREHNLRGGRPLK